MKFNFRNIGLLIFVLAVFSSCSRNDEFSLKEKELRLKEQELALKEKEIEKGKGSTGIDLNGSYQGTIKDGTEWFVYIRDFDGRNFSGSNNIFWKKAHSGYDAKFTGTYDESTGEIIIYEDQEVRNAGKFVGNVYNSGESMSGIWIRYSDGGSYNWEVKKID